MCPTAKSSVTSGGSSLVLFPFTHLGRGVVGGLDRLMPKQLAHIPIRNPSAISHAKVSVAGGSIMCPDS